MLIFADRMYDLRLIEYNSAEYQEMMLLRKLLLRTPLGLTFSEEDLQKEISDLLIGCFLPEEGQMIGCCVLTPIDENIVQLRQMAILEKFQRQGVGRQLVAFAEKEALLSGFSVMTMHAREEAVAFYEKQGYEKTGKPFIEVTISHLKMKKELKSQEN